MLSVMALPAEAAAQLRSSGRLAEGTEAVVVAVGHGWLAQVGELADALAPSAEVPTPVLLEAARRNAVDRRRAAEEFGLLTAVEVADVLDSVAANRSAAAYNLRRAGRIFAVPAPGGDRYPGFQFDPVRGRPWPALPPVLEILTATGATGWELLSWFTTPTGWLADRRPADLLATAPAEVLDASRHQVEELGF